MLLYEKQTLTYRFLAFSLSQITYVNEIVLLKYF